MTDDAYLVLMRREVAKGGVYFRCTCGKTGVFAAGSKRSLIARKHLKVPLAPCGVDMKEGECLLEECKDG